MVKCIVLCSQLKITDVHIRYEDNITVPNEAFAFGITMDTLSAQSCDDTWQPRYLSGDSGPNSFKLLELSALGVYWDKLDSSGLLGDLSLGELAVCTLSHHHTYFFNLTEVLFLILV